MKGLIDRGNSSLLIEMSRKIGNVLNEEDSGDEHADEDSFTLDILQEKDFFNLDSRITSICMNDGLCNNSAITKWDFSVYANLKDLVVGDDCIRYVKSVVLSGFTRLEKVSIGSYCCVSAVRGSLVILHCNELRTLSIGHDCCLEWGEFVLKDCALVKEVSIGDGSFVSCEQAAFESRTRAGHERIDLPELTQLKIGREVFKGSTDKDSSFVMRGKFSGSG